jgi:ATP-dependent Clp protease protease subunit
VVPNARVLIHQPSIDVMRGQTSDLEIYAAEVARLRRQLEEALAEGTGQPVERIHADIERDRILTADEAVAYGIADNVITSRKLSR